MQKNILILLTLMITFISGNAHAKGETTKTSFKVWGNCDQCKKRIEKAAKTEGVKSAVWDEESKLITVVFRPDKTSVDKIQQNIAKAGHDTEKIKADDKDYNNLPQCCHYDRKN
jgi:copper chaperone CopZ